MIRRLVLLACAGGVLLALLAAGDLLFGAPYRANANRIAALQVGFDDMTARLADARRRLAAADATEPVDLAELVTAGTDGAAALAALQERVRRAVAENGAQALSTTGASSAPVDGVSRLTVGLSGRFEEAALFEFLRELEGGAPPLLVDALTVRPVPAPGGLPLDVSVTLVSFQADNHAP